jgi:hypothetical protein
MKYFNYLKLSLLAFFLFSEEILAGPLSDYIDESCKNVMRNLHAEDASNKLNEYKSIVGTTFKDQQNFFRPKIAAFLREEQTKLDQPELFEKQHLFEKLNRLYSLVKDLRIHLNPAQKDTDLTESQIRIYNNFNRTTEEAYRGFLTLSLTILEKTTQEIIEDDIEFCEIYNALKAYLSEVLNCSILSLKTNNISDILTPFYVYGYENNPKPLPALINNSSHLEQKLKETLQLINDPEFLQQNLRKEAHLFFAEQKTNINQLKEQFNNILQYYLQKENITEQINYRRQEVAYTSTNPTEAIEKKSLQDIFNELGLNRNSLIAQLNTMSKNIQFAAQNILPYTIEEFYVPLDFNQHTKQNNYYKLLMNTGTTLSANALVLIEVLADGDRFALVNPAHLTFYWNLLENLEGFFGSYEKYLGIPIDDDNQQNPPLFVHIRNL